MTRAEPCDRQVQDPANDAEERRDKPTERRLKLDCVFRRAERNTKRGRSAAESEGATWRHANSCAQRTLSRIVGSKTRRQVKP